MKTKKIPLRTCVVSKEQYPKQELIRIVKTPDGNVLLDLTGKLNGKGAYLKKDIEIIKKAQNKQILNIKLGVNVPDSIYEELMNMV